MSLDVLNQFAFPDAAREDMTSRGLTQKIIPSSGAGGTVSEFQMQGHEKGVPYRFFTIVEKHGMKSEEFDMEINKEEDCIEWFVHKKHKPTERLRLLPEGLIKFSKDVFDKQGNLVRKGGECTGGILKDAYLRWKQGLQTPGLPLERWGKLSMSQVLTLQSEGVFTVEQFCSMPRDRVEGRFPREFVDAFDNAIQWQNAQAPSQQVEKYAEILFKKEQEHAQELNKLRGEIEKLLDGKGEEKPVKKRGPNKKIITPEEAN